MNHKAISLATFLFLAMIGLSDAGAESTDTLTEGDPEINDPIRKSQDKSATANYLTMQINNDIEKRFLDPDSFKDTLNTRLDQVDRFKIEQTRQQIQKPERRVPELEKGF